MSKQQSDHGNESWFQEREAAREAGGTAPEGTDPALNEQDGAAGGAANPQTPQGENTGNRGVGQYSGQGVPAREQK